MPLIVPPTAAAGSAPKDATERRAMQSGTSFVTGQCLSNSSRDFLSIHVSALAHWVLFILLADVCFGIRVLCRK